MKAQYLANTAVQVSLDAGETLVVGEGSRGYTLTGPTVFTLHAQPGLALEAALAAANVAILPVQPVIPDRCSKLGLKRALSETGSAAAVPATEWAAVKALIAQNPDLQEDWDLAVDLVRTDPLVQGVITARSYTPAQVDEILTRAAALVS